MFQGKNKSNTSSKITPLLIRSHGSGHTRAIVSLEGNNLEQFYYLCVFEIWPDKRDDLI